MKWQDTGNRFTTQTVDGETVEGREEELVVDCCEVKVKHFHCSCGAALHLFPITEGNREIERSVYAFANPDRLQYKWGKATVHDIVDCVGTLLQRGRHDREYPTFDCRPDATAEERLHQPLSTHPDARSLHHFREQER